MSDFPEDAPNGEGALLLDPFDARKHWASRIPGLGGPDPSPDPGYVFVTHDSRPAIGRVRATVHFHDLAATYGTFLFEVRARSAVPGAEHVRLQTLTLTACDLVMAGGFVELSFESYRNTYYAVACSINDETDVQASHISISIDRRATPAQHGRAWEWSPERATATNRRPGIETALVRRSLTDLAIPQLGAPMSQVGSPLQCREPAFAQSMQALRREVAGTFENWSLAYVLQAINRFAVRDRGRLLGYGQDEAPLMSYFAGRGSEVVGMRHLVDGAEPLDPGQALQELWVPDLCDEAAFFTHAHFVTGDIRQTFETFRDQFDILWSINVNRHMTPQEFIPFVVNGLTHVRPGGLAVHVFDYSEDLDGERQHSLTRHEIERIAVLALSHHNDVARLQFVYGAPAPVEGTPLPFGLVLLRGGAQRVLGTGSR